MLSRNQFSLLFIMCSLGAMIMYSIPDLFIWLYSSGVTPEKLVSIVAVFCLLIFAILIWIVCYVEQRQANKIRRAMDIQKEINGSGAKNAKAGDVIKPRGSGFRFQRSND